MPKIFLPGVLLGVDGLNAPSPANRAVNPILGSRRRRSFMSSTLGYTPPQPTNNLIAVFGDSRTQSNSGDFPDTKTINVQGYVPWLLDGLGYRARLARGCNFGVGGSKTDNSEIAPKGMTSSRLAEVAACAAGTIIFLGGVNDGSDASVTIANYITILDALAAAGKVVVLCNELPFTAGNAGQQAAQIDRRNWLEDPARRVRWPNIVQVDTFRPCLKDGTSCDFKDGYAPYQSPSDTGGLHPLTLGNSVIGRTIAAAIAYMYAANTSDRNAPTSAGDSYNASTNPFGCLVPGFMMTGTTGTMDNVANAGVATGWNIVTTNSGGATVTPSKGVDSDGFASQIIDVIPSGVAGNRTISVANLTNAAGNLNQLTGGDKVAASARIKISDPGPNGVAIGAQVNGTYGGVPANLTAYNWAGTSVSARSNDLDVIQTSQIADVNAGWATGTSRIYGTLGNIAFAGDGPTFRVELSRAGCRRVAA